jgi:Ser/Thr protein kinase RdoA (MazF antagonist)
MELPMNDSTQHPFETLTPDFIINAVESRGFVCDGRLLALNSYENRVYQVGIEEAQPLIAKFYRPGRWNDAQIGEEHAFCFELAGRELPVVAPLAGDDGESLHYYEGFRFALFPRRGGHAPELDNLDNLLILGRLLGRMHLVGATLPFLARPRIDCASFGYASIDFISSRFIPPALKTAYDTLTADLMKQVEPLMDYANRHLHWIRVHGDCHAGNMLWRDDAPHFVDFDDTCMAPAVQDVWMLLSGGRAEQTVQLAEILEGYHEFYEFDPRELRLIEALRTLRMIHYSAWLARRWEDPAFPRSFPWFNTVRYWEEHILSLREQFAALNEPPLEIM